jgi:RNA polymerase sigma factor (sigma-70 family)
MVKKEKYEKLLREFINDAEKELAENHPGVGGHIIGDTIDYVRNKNKLYLDYEDNLLWTKKEAKRQLWGRLKVKLVLVEWKKRMSDPEYARLYTLRKGHEPKSQREQEFIEFYIGNCISQNSKKHSKAVNRVLRDFKRIDVDLHDTDYTHEAEIIVSNTVRIAWKNREKIQISVHAYFWSVLRNQIIKRANEINDEKDHIVFTSPFSHRITREEAVPTEEIEDHQAIETYMGNNPTYTSVDDIGDYYWKRHRAVETGSSMPEEPVLIDLKGDTAPIGKNDRDLNFIDQSDHMKPLVGDLDKGKIKRAISTLPKKQQRVIELCIFEGHSQVSIAKKLGITQQAVSSRLKQALITLESVIDPYDVGFKARWRDILNQWE